MNFAERAKLNGTKLELSWYPTRNCWRKKFQGKSYYFGNPGSLEGYQKALASWVVLKAKLNGQRPNVDVWTHHRDLFSAVQNYWNQFGLPRSEAALAKQVDRFLAYCEKTLDLPELPETIPYRDFPELAKEFLPATWLGDNFRQGKIGLLGFQLPEKWKDRLQRLDKKENVKEPQIIEYWIQKYLNRIDSRKEKFITIKTAKDRNYKLSHFQKSTDLQNHIDSLNADWIEKYLDLLNEQTLSAKSKSEYWKAVKMFLRWAGGQQSCEYQLPKNLDSSESSFREPAGTGRSRQAKKALLWTPEEFQAVLEGLQSPQHKAYLLLMLNCGFRHIDLSNLRKSDLDLGNRRITIQRNKLNQQATAPVISYLLWESTAKAIEGSISEDPTFVFLNSAGKQVENSIKIWWKRKAVGKRLDYLRKTGSTIIAKLDRGLDEFYLGESLNSTARISYSFSDGEINPQLDNAILQLGEQFGLATAPAKAVQLTPEMIAALKAAGFSL